jgi:hypothetical protein
MMRSGVTGVTAGVEAAGDMDFPFDVRLDGALNSGMIVWRRMGFVQLYRLILPGKGYSDCGKVYL